MQLLNWFSLLALVALPVLAKEPPTNLVIDTIYKPADCSVFAKTGDSIRVHYTGTLFSNGEKFDSSRDRNSPLPLTLGVGQVIKGWDEGLQGMCVNEKRVLTIPADKAYGTRGFGSVIPPNSALVFDVELISLQPKNGGHEEL
ncbi:hypothetical protein NP233_g5098 [Leucocoprinus birnbaumii]|uniref:peptidylprolyl isomerase n=1 Tax=Leucocoprinus birnbaumii TaxID=56174 RepID=A0AAD5VVT9_9AGAR|nr:hypothetical protein NP233_g10201 [Leucocoprinus birnbaumii]KAJ3569360.1 hypothetical protein NP233_g5098 [Leucocoprinus birnbaumii]